MRSILTLEELMILNKSQQTVALTDINTVRGFINFVQFAKSNNMAPIAGVNLITNVDEIIILVENDIGYENMCSIITNYYANPNCSAVEFLKENIYLRLLLILCPINNTYKLMN